MRILLNKKESGIPSEYIEVEYLESTGTQYIDTGIYFDNNTTFEFKSRLIYQTNGYPAIYGARVGSSNNDFQIYYNNSTAGGTPTSLCFRNGNTTYTINASSLGFTDFLNKDIEVKSTATNITVNEYSVSVSYKSGTRTPYPVILFAQRGQNSMHATNYGAQRIYKYKIWQGTTLVRDFIPCIRKIDQVAGMYDLVSKQFFTNSGTGSFIAGPVVKLPKGYDIVEYIESTGTQWIDTGFKPDNNTKVECKLYNPTNFNTAKQGSILFGARHSGNTPTFTVIGNILNNYGTRWDYGTSAISTTNNPLTVGEHTIVKDKQYNYLDGNLVTTNVTNSFSINYSMHIFGTNTAGTNTLPFVGRYYYFKIYDDNNLVRNFVPAIRTSDKVAGLYDTVEDKFYVNQGSGTFKTGPYLALPEGYQELDYIESTGTQYIDTGFIPNQDSKAELTFQHTTQSTVVTAGAIFGERGSSAVDRAFCLASEAGATTSTRFDIQFGNSTVAGDPQFDFNKHTIIIAKNGYWDGNLAYKSTDTFTGAYSCWLFGRQSTANVTNPCKIFACKLWDNDVLVRNFIPAIRQADEVLGMYDLVSKQFFTNNGTGSFKTGDIPKPPKATTQRLIFSKPHKVLPDEYTQVEYLESTGTQYIDTEYKGNTETAFEAKIQYTPSGSFSTGSFGSLSPWFRLAFTATTIYNQRGASSTSLTMPYDTNIHTYYNSPTLLKIDDNELIITKATIAANNNMFLFAWSDNASSAGQYCKAKLYSFKIYDNNTLVRDFIPAIRKIDNVAGMYDLVTKQFFTNQGTGSFLTGPLLELPDDYQQIDYIGSTGQQFILTGYTPTINTDFEVKFGSTSPNTGCWVMGAPTWVGVHYKGTSVGVTNSSAGIAQQYTSYNHDDTPITLKLTGDTVYANGNQLGTIERRAGTLDFALFGYRDTNQGASIRYTGKIYSAKIWENGLLVRNFIPCIRKSDNVAGMYDLVTKQLYTNSGTGVFNVGDLTLPKRIQRLIFIPSKPYKQVEYLESTGTQYIDTDLSIDSYEDNELVVSLEYTDVSGSQLFGNNNGGYFGVKDGKDYNVATKTISVNTPYIYDIKRSGGTFTRTLNGASYSTGRIQTRATSPVYLFAIGGFTSLSYTKCKVKHFEYYVGDILVRDLIPVIRLKDNIPCMYDLVTKQFFLNLGTGTFIAGDPI